MASRNGLLQNQHMYRFTGLAMVRATPHTELVPAWPDLDAETPVDAERWRTWLRNAWTLDVVSEAVEHASPVLAGEVNTPSEASEPDLRRARQAALSVARYMLRMASRATPFGLFAGVAAAGFGPKLAARWGTAHEAVARADPSWVAAVIARLESCPELVARLPVMRNNLAFLRGDRLIVPYPPQMAPQMPQQRHGRNRRVPAEVSVRYTAAVRLVVEAARAPIRYDELAGKLAAEFPDAPPVRIDRLLAELVERSVLITGLRAPSTVVDAFEHLTRQLDAARATDVPQVAELVRRLRGVSEELARHNATATTEARRAVRTATTKKMTAVDDTARQPVAVDLMLDCSLVLPQHVAREAEAAASVLTLLSPYPFGTTAWKDYHNRFFERYGIGSLVPLLDVVNPDVGLGFPAGYLGEDSEKHEPMTARDRRLLILAQEAALDGRDEVVLDDSLIAALTVGDHNRVHVPPHIELRFQLLANNEDAVDGGDFQLSVVSASRGIGTTTGRFIGLLEPTARERTATVFSRLPTSDPNALSVQLSFPPLDPRDAHVCRTPSVLPAVLSLAEHRAPAKSVIALDDLAVGCDRRRLYLASLSRRRLVEPSALHALDLRGHAPPLARFLAEVSRSLNAVVTGFDWGAALALPFLPRIRYGRTILSPTRWRLDRRHLPGSDAPWTEWRRAMAAWRSRRRLPTAVQLVEADRLLRLDLDEPAHLDVLRAHLDASKDVVLAEAPAPDAHGWFGGRAHEVVTALTAAQASTWPAAPPVASNRVISRDHGRIPGASAWLMAKLYGHPERQPEIIAHHLPELLAEWDEPPPWWYLRYRDPDWHLRLRIALPDLNDFGTLAGRIGRWAASLRRQGLLRDLQLATSYPETGRWGTGTLMAAAESVFCADSHALAVQFAQPHIAHAQTLAAANIVAIACGFTRSVQAGMSWLIDHARIGPSPRGDKALDRTALAEAVRMANPANNWAALCAEPGGQAITEAWEPRRHALAEYRARLTEDDSIAPDLVLDSLLHAHHIRAVGLDKNDERICVRLARAAALAWNARHRGSEQ